MMRIDEPAVQIRGAVKAFDAGSKRPRWWRRAAGAAERKRVVAVDHVDLDVQRGEILGVLGANGGGKSTLIRLISTLLLPDEGEVRVFGLDIVKHENEIKRVINRVSVEASFFKKLSPMENLLYAARLYGMDVGPARPEIIAILGRLGIERERVFEPLEKMSRGMQQKVAIARALLTSPVLLLLDEPTTGLDPRSKREVQQFVLDVREKHDATVLLTTHDMDEAERLCDRIAIMRNGRIIAQGTAEELKRSIGAEGETSLEEVFMHLTGHTLEDEETPEDAAPVEVGA